MKKLLFLLVFVFSLTSYSQVAPPKPFGAVPNENQMRWQEMEYYSFLHFSINTFTDQEWGGGDESASLFNPKDLDCRQWARVCKEAGMKGIILTVKHHCGFCLWPSKYTEFSVKNSPWKDGKGDVVRELADACKEYGLKLGVYLSPWDRNHADYGKPEYIEYFRNQLTELLTNYGPIFEVWFDGANGGSGYYGGARETRKIDPKTYYDWKNTYALIRKLQPNIVIWNDGGDRGDLRWVGTEAGFVGETNWSLLNAKGDVSTDMLRFGLENGDSWVPGEVNTSIRPGWFYHTNEDSTVKTLFQLLNIYYSSAGRNPTLLLNFPIDTRGLIHENDVKASEDFATAVKETFAVNLAEKAKVSSSNVRGNSKEFGAEKTIDGNKDTYWATDDGMTNASLTIDLMKPTTFNHFLVQEYIRLGQRVKTFTVEVLVDGIWKEVAKATTIGYKRILQFPDVKATKVRFTITDSKSCPVISNLGIYNAPLNLTADLLGQRFPFQNPGLSSEERSKDLISRLTIEEKASLMCDQSDAIPRLGIKKFNWWSEALHGLANNEKVTVFPEPIGMAASFDDDLTYQIFDAVSDETRAKYNEAIQKGLENKRFLSLSVWTPNINIFRDPRWGRGQETYGEDPYLTSRMGVSVVKGLQGPADSKYRKLLACAKHFAVHSGPEWSRHSLNLNNIDPRELWETYLPAFKSLVQDADVRQVMCAYQRIDDEPCCGNSRLLQSILRDDWDYKYMVVSDCDAIADFYTGHNVSSDPAHASAKSVLAGTDVECAWQSYAFKDLPEAIEKGLISEEEINRHLIRSLIGRFDLGEMDEDTLVPWTKIPVSVINNGDHRKLALEMARESMTLLQNKNNILPLKKSAKKIAVIGPNADNEPVLWGNYNGTPVGTITILEGITSKIQADKILYDKGCELVDNNAIESYIPNCSFAGTKGFKATYWNNTDFKGDAVLSQYVANPILQSVSGQNTFATGVNQNKFSVKYETVFEPTRDETIVLRYGATGLFELTINGESIKKYNNWRTVIAKTPFRVEKGKKYNIEIRLTQQNDWVANVDFNFGKEKDVDYSNLLKKLQGIDLVIFAGGLSTQVEGEEMPVELPGFRGGDRTDIELPATQRNCLQALKQAGKKIVFINCSGSAVGLIPETESCDAILQAWYSGESGGQAIADVLFGDYNPSGKLPVTFYRNMQQLPDFEDYSMRGRTYRYMSDPLFPFGFGLSYTTFSIGNAEISANKLTRDGDVNLIIPVSNTGKRDGTEIVQVYIHKVNDIDGPLKTLKGFKRVNIAAGKTSDVNINMPNTAFEFYDKTSGKMAVTSGDYEVWYGNSSHTKDLKMTIVTIHKLND